MDGRGRWMDNVFIERLWRSLKHEDVYLKGYADGREARLGIAAWIDFYNRNRPHQALGYATPMAVWCDGVVDTLAARAVDMIDNERALSIMSTAAKSTADSSSRCMISESRTVACPIKKPAPVVLSKGTTSLGWSAGRRLVEPIEVAS